MKYLPPLLFAGLLLSPIGCDSPNQLGPDSEEPDLAALKDQTEPSVPTYRRAKEGQIPYTVVLRGGTDDYGAARNSILEEEDGSFYYQFRRFGNRKAFIASFTPEAAARLSKDPRVYSIQADTAQLKLLATRTVSDTFDWGLDRIDASSGLNSTYNFYADGSGVHIFFLDTGIDSTHSEFSGRCGPGMTVPDFIPASPYVDSVGHGTKVAGVALGGHFGVATDATCHSVKVTESRTVLSSNMQAGIDYSVDAAISNNWLPAIINISVGTDNSGTAQKINDAFDDGILVITGAGNDNVSAYGDAGNRAYGSLVVGGTDIHDERWEWNDSTGSNWGSTVDLMAPSEYIWTAQAGGDSVNAAGTSIASPFTAGVAALILENNTSMSPTLLKEILVDAAWSNQLVTSTLDGSPNRLLNSISLWIEDDWSGPTWIAEEDQYEFQGPDAVGGTLSYTYQWWYSTDGSNFTLAFTGQDYTRNIQEDDPDFWLKVKVLSGSYYKITGSKKVELCWNHDNGENCEW